MWQLEMKTLILRSELNMDTTAIKWYTFLKTYQEAYLWQ